jgi:hypothetical protein
MYTCLSKVNNAVSLAARTSCLLQNHVSVWLNEPEGWRVEDLRTDGRLFSMYLEGGIPQFPGRVFFLA